MSLSAVKSYSYPYRSLNILLLSVLYFILIVNSHYTAGAQDLKNKKTSIDLFQNGQNLDCFRIPAIIMAKNGDLLVAADQRVGSCNDLRSNEDINIVLRKSYDKGKTWEEIQTVIDFPVGLSASDPSFILDQITGDLFLFYNFMDLRQEKDIYYLHVLKSSDNGNTWSAPRDITSKICPPAWKSDFKFITSGRGIQLSSGKLVHTLVNLKRGVFLFQSEDHGEHWNRIDVPIQPADESKIIELLDGRWMINSRVNDEKIRYIHISDDKGTTWNSYPDHSLIDPSCNASIIRLSGRDRTVLLFSNPASATNRSNLGIRYSRNEGSTWSKPRIIYSGSSAYSDMIELGGRRVGIVFEKDNYEKITFDSFSIDWLMDTSRK